MQIMNNYDIDTFCSNHASCEISASDAKIAVTGANEINEIFQGITDQNYAVQLLHIWNDTASSHRFLLFCTYSDTPLNLLDVPTISVDNTTVWQFQTGDTARAKLRQLMTALL